MKQYQELLKHVLQNGQKRSDRTGTGTISCFGTQTRYRVSAKAFPLVTTKFTWWKGVVHELVWMVQGQTNIEYLVQNSVHIWDAWPYKKFQASKNFKGESLKDFSKKIGISHKFAQQNGELGPVYGAQWRNFFGVDQLQEAINQIKTNPTSRRIIVSSWNPPQLYKMLLPPCHSFYQFYVLDNKLSLQLYQRSADLFLGVPFNIASYSLLLLIVAKITNLEPHEFIHTIGDAHIYLNHLQQVQRVLTNKPLTLPQVIFKKEVKTLQDFTYESVELSGYKSHGKIFGKVAV